MSTNFIKTIEHGFAVAAMDVVKAAKTVESTVVPALKKVNADAATIEAVTSLVSPQAAAIERMAFGILGQALKANDDAVAAVNGGGLNVTLDAELVADLKVIAVMLKPAAAAVVSK